MPTFPAIDPATGAFQTPEVLARLDERYRHGVSARRFGAKGDGTTDDTAALQSWLNEPGVAKYLPAGVYPISTGLTSSLADHVITGPGVLKVTTAEIDALTLTGARPVVDGIGIDGNSLGRYGIYTTGEDPTIERTRIFALKSLTGSTRGIYTSSAGGAIIRNNRISNVGGPGNASQGDGNGMVRAIVLHANANAAVPSLCVGNRIDNIWGEEADAISLLYSDAVTDADAYQSGFALIQGNIIRNSGRRYIKVQGSDVVVDGNWCWATPDFVPSNPSSVLDLIQGDRVRFTRNRVYDTGLTSALSIKGPTDVYSKDITIDGNYLSEGESTSPVIYSANAEDVTITGNTLVGGSNYVSAGLTTNLVVAHNTCRGGGTGAAFSFTSSATGKVRYNTIPTGRTVGTATNVTFEGNA